MGFQDIAFLPPNIAFLPHFLKIVVAVKASRPARPRTVAGKGMLPVKHLHLNKASFCEPLKFHGDHQTVTQLRRLWPPSLLRTVVSVYICIVVI